MRVRKRKHGISNVEYIIILAAVLAIILVSSVFVRGVPEAAMESKMQHSTDYWTRQAAPFRITEHAAGEGVFVGVLENSEAEPVVIDAVELDAHPMGIANRNSQNAEGGLEFAIKGGERQKTVLTYPEGFQPCASANFYEHKVKVSYHNKNNPGTPLVQEGATNLFGRCSQPDTGCIECPKSETEIVLCCPPLTCLSVGDGLGVCVYCGNGICTSALGENCVTCPEDCDCQTIFGECSECDIGERVCKTHPGLGEHCGSGPFQTCCNAEHVCDLLVGGGTCQECLTAANGCYVNGANRCCDGLNCEQRLGGEFCCIPESTEIPCTSDDQCCFGLVCPAGRCIAQQPDLVASFEEPRPQQVQTVGVAFNLVARTSNIGAGAAGASTTLVNSPSDGITFNSAPSQLIPVGQLGANVGFQDDTISVVCTSPGEKTIKITADSENDVQNEIIEGDDVATNNVATLVITCMLSVDIEIVTSGAFAAEVPIGSVSPSISHWVRNNGPGDFYYNQPSPSSCVGRPTVSTWPDGSLLSTPLGTTPFRGRLVIVRFGGPGSEIDSWQAVMPDVPAGATAGNREFTIYCNPGFVQPGTVVHQFIGAYNCLGDPPDTNILNNYVFGTTKCCGSEGASCPNGNSDCCSGLYCYTGTCSQPFDLEMILTEPIPSEVAVGTFYTGNLQIRNNGPATSPAFTDPNANCGATRDPPAWPNGDPLVMPPPFPPTYLGAQAHAGASRMLDGAYAGRVSWSGRSSEPSLAPGQSIQSYYRVNCEQPYASAGNLAQTFSGINSCHDFAETDYSNNYIFRTVKCCGTGGMSCPNGNSDCCSGLVCIGGNCQLAPDLVAFLPNPPGAQYVGVPFSLAVRTSNEGDGNAPSSVTLVNSTGGLTFNTQASYPINVVAIAAHSSAPDASVPNVVCTSSGQKTIRITADNGGAVSEANEGNNVWTHNIQCSSGGYLYLNIPYASYDLISLSWSGVTGATQYKVYRQHYTGGGDDPFVLVATLGSSARSYTDYGVSEDRWYQYKVEAWAGSILLTYEYRGFVRTMLIPPAIQGCWGIGGGQVRCEWTGQSSYATSYRVYRTTESQGFTNPAWDAFYAEVPVANNFFVDSSASGAGMYYYKIVAANEHSYCCTGGHYGVPLDRMQWHGTTSYAASNAKHFFVVTQLHNSDFDADDDGNAMTELDAYCNSNKPAGANRGPYRAWIQTSTTDTSHLLNGNTQYIWVNNAAGRYASFLTTSGRTPGIQAWNHPETGGSVSGYAWTNLNWGASGASSGATACNAWTATSGTASVGTVNAQMFATRESGGTFSWMRWSSQSAGSCSGVGSAHVYCFEP